MLKSYLKIAFRGFLRNKLFTLINIIGLSIGISAALVIYLFVHFDLTFDKFEKDNDRIYRVVSNYAYKGEPGWLGGVCGPLPASIKTNLTGTETIAPFFTLSSVDITIPRKENAQNRFKNQAGVILAGPEYFSLMNYQWLAGSPKSALAEPNQTVITSEEAEKYFPSMPYNQLIGKYVIYDTLKTTVSGVVKTLSENSDFNFIDFISYSTALSPAHKTLYDKLDLSAWGNTNSASQLFVKLLPNTIPANFVKQLNNLLNKNYHQAVADKDYSVSLGLQPLSDLHFNDEIGIFDSTLRIANKTTIFFLLAIAAFLLLLACINFINLTTAQAARRAKEIGIRKTLGTSRRQLIAQFLSETFVITLAAVVISLALAPVILKLFGDFIPSGAIKGLLQPSVLLFLLLLTLIVGFASGFYPAMVLSGFKPVLVLKSQQGATGGKTRNATLRKSLTVIQFTVALFFIMATVLVSKQIYYALHKDLGLKKDAILVVGSPKKNGDENKNQVLLNKWRTLPQVEMISLCGEPPSFHYASSSVSTYKDGKKEISTNVLIKYADENYLSVYHIKLLAGRSLRGDERKKVVINKTYADILGFSNPGDAIGKMLGRATIIGVTADFHEKSLHEPIKPLVIYRPNSDMRQEMFHIALKPQTSGNDDWRTAIALMGKSWKEIYPDNDFEYRFFDETIAMMYDEEQRTSTLLRWATGLSIFISCLGLLGLAIYTTNQRTKEIGVRKVLGATVLQMVTLLSTELILLILLAFAIVTPVAWWAMNKWMQSFADRTSISWWIFVASGGGMLLLAISTSAFQTVKAASANPVNSLRSE